MKKIINQLHAKAEFYKRAAWAHYNMAKGSDLFKDELLKLAKEHADACRFYREQIRKIIAGNQDDKVLMDWVNAGAPADYWD